MLSLPLSVPLGEQEPAFSFMSRLASRNGLPTSTFGADFELPFSKIIQGDELVCQRLAELGGVALDALLEWTPIHLGGREHSFRGEIFHAKSIKPVAIRGCPACLREDMAKDPSPWMPHMRADWLLRHLRVCTEHEMPLVDLWADPASTVRFDFAARLAEIRTSLEEGGLDGEPREASLFELYVADRLHGQHSGNWFDGIDLQAVCVFSELLGRAAVRLETGGRNRVHPDELWAEAATGYVLSAEGPDQVRDTLARLQSKLGAPRQGPKGVFGDLYDRFAHELTSEPYGVFRGIIRDHILATWPVGAGDNVMGEPVLERRLHSVRTAAEEGGIDDRRLRKLLRERGILTGAALSSTDEWAVFDAKAVKPIIEELNRMVSGIELQQLMNISRSQFESLRADGYLSPAIAAAGAKPLWKATDAHRFVADLLRGAETVHAKMHGWRTLQEACHQLRVRPAEIIDLIKKGELRRIGSYSQATGYASILVDRDELQSKLNIDHAPGLTLEVFAKSVGLKPTQMTQLVASGHIRATNASNPKRKAVQPYITESDRRSFDETFVPLRRLSLETGWPWQKLLSPAFGLLERRFFDGETKHENLFLWTALERHFLCHWPKRE
ncbi:TniQ family protein [Limimaricola cinnabarinus]|uniref:TniQ domain-containing protein n=1 Tax=Limimaricola cinnabarinus TaxID=1125964 RepID=A0A2G1MJ87_9RHOB|nr:TniQ family protein [Limimaricola cinnabarinus]PHP28690.1 hypothetical protein CJ301_05685 [Limimaricola cinnabarinus]